jgi:predicted RNA-binding Zn ribbon-like protein
MVIIHLITPLKSHYRICYTSDIYRKGGPTEMTTMHEEQSKAAPGQLALVQALVNTQYGYARRTHTVLTNPEQLRVWLVAQNLLADDVPVTEGDFRRVLLLREELRSLLRANNETEMLASQVEGLNRLASNAPLTVRFHHDGLPTLEPDIAGVDGTLAHLVGIVFTAMTDGSWGRLKVCRNDRCQKAFYDTSKNRSGAWCSMAGCGSRLKARAYRHRRTAHLEG